MGLNVNGPKFTDSADILRRFDKNNDGHIDDTELAEMNGFFKGLAGKDGKLSKRELKKSGIYEKKDLPAVQSAINTLNAQKKAIEEYGFYTVQSEDGTTTKVYANGRSEEYSAEKAGDKSKTVITRNGIFNYSVTDNRENGDSLISVYDEEGGCLLFTLETTKDKSVRTNYNGVNEDGSPKLKEKTCRYDYNNGWTATYDDNGHIASYKVDEKRDNVVYLTDYDCSGQNATEPEQLKLDKPRQVIKNWGNLDIAETTTYTYAEDGAVTEVTKNSAGEVISTVNKDKDGKPKEPPKKEQPAQVHSYTVQNGESITAIAKKLLEAQGKEPTSENIAEAKKAIIDANPGTIRTFKGAKGSVQGFRVGAKINLPGLEDKTPEEIAKTKAADLNNATEQSKNYETRVEDQKAVAMLDKFVSTQPNAFIVNEPIEITNFSDSELKLGVKKAYLIKLTDSSTIQIYKDDKDKIIKICIKNFSDKDNTYDNVYYKDKLEYRKNGTGDFITANNSYKPVRSFDQMTEIAQNILNQHSLQ